MKKSILFVGASGTVASKVIPLLAEDYSVVGVSKNRADLAKYCDTYYTADLITESEELARKLFRQYSFDSVIWNIVRYFPSPILESQRETMHIEFDLGVALPVEWLKASLKQKSNPPNTFILVTSLLAFFRELRWGSYSLVKREQIILAEYVGRERPGIPPFPKAIALGDVSDTRLEIMRDAFIRCIENRDKKSIFYRVFNTHIEADPEPK